jgi:class 3 adenylate cyclase
MTEPAPDASGTPTPDELRRNNLRLSRRVARLEDVLRNVEQIRDTNTRLLDRLMGELAAERERSEQLLLNVLPQRIVDRLHAGEQRIADRHDDVAVVFGDLVGFTDLSARRSPAEVVEALNGLFSAFDAACAGLGVEKIKTIGDAYLAAAGLPGGSEAHVAAAADLALAMLAAVEAAGPPWQIRIGVHSGPVVAGIVGTTKFLYDIWGDAVNTASRLETTAPPGRIQVSERVAQVLGGDYELEARGEVDLKGKGPMRTFFLVAKRVSAG